MSETREVEPGCLMFILLALLVFASCRAASSLAKIARNTERPVAEVPRGK